MGSLNALISSGNVLKCVENPLPSYCDTLYFTFTAMENLDHAKKNNLSTMKHAHDTALAVIQVNLKTWKSKSVPISVDIPGIKSPDKLKCQEIKKCVLTKATIGEVFFSRGRVVYKLRNSQQFFYCKVYSGLLSKSFI